MSAMKAESSDKKHLKKQDKFKIIQGEYIMKVIIVGGVAGGATAAARLRRLDEKAEIIIFEKNGYVSYANCGLPYYVGGVIGDFDELTLQSPEGFFSRYRIDVRVRHEVVKIDTAAKTVDVRNLDTGKTFTESYDKLLLSPGARPVNPGIEGADCKRVFTLRTVEDTVRIKAFADAHKPARAMVIGGGFIGLETAENLSRLNIDTTVVEFADHILGPFDRDMASLLHAEMRRGGVKIMLKTAVSSISEKGDALLIETRDGGKFETDMVVLAAGVAPDTGLAAAAGIKTGIKGSIVVNKKMETSAPDVYAVGDAVEVENLALGTRALISLAGPANKQGRIAADNIAGGNSEYDGSFGTSVIKVFSLTAASVGANEAQLKAAGKDYEKVVLSPLNHAGYYPGGKVMTMKVLFDKSTLKIYGAQIAGSEGVDKRIDVIATAMRAGLSAVDLKDLELAYAPPYSSAKDPVNVAGFMIENVVTGKVKQFHYEDVASLPSSVFKLDARTPYEYARGHAEGFVNIPLDEIRERLDEIDKNKPVYVMCQSGLRSYLACRILAQNGFDCYNFSGGYRFYDIVSRDVLPAASAYPCGKDKN